MLDLFFAIAANSSLSKCLFLMVYAVAGAFGFGVDLTILTFPLKKFICFFWFAR